VAVTTGVNVVAVADAADVAAVDGRHEAGAEGSPEVHFFSVKAASRVKSESNFESKCC
jgi:metal-dependent HD superfamily phosphatase/phosphodiesterase